MDGTLDPMATALSTDLYEITMAAGYVTAGITDRASFELSVRSLPANRSYLIAAGLEPALEYLENLAFTAAEIKYLRGLPALRHVPSDFFDETLPSLRFTGDVWAMPEGTPVFPHEPLIRVTAPLVEAQLVETTLLSTLSFQTSVASRAARIVDAADGRPVFEFGARRAHGTDAGVFAARGAYVGGCGGTSMVEAGYRYGVPLTGTMAHSWVMCFDTETEAYERYMDLYGRQAVLLIDTYDSATAVDRIARAGLRPGAVRIDSGDLLTESQSVRSRLNAVGLAETSIFVSGDLDETRIAGLVGADAPIDGFGVGNALSTVSDAPALGGVYKLVEIERNGEVRPTLKLSHGKTTFPGRKQVWRLANSHGIYTHDVIHLADDDGAAGGHRLLDRVMVDGQRSRIAPTLNSVQTTTRAQLNRLPAAVRDMHQGEQYPVHRSQNLERLMTELSDTIRGAGE